MVDQGSLRAIARPSLTGSDISVNRMIDHHFALPFLESSVRILRERLVDEAAGWLKR